MSCSSLHQDGKTGQRDKSASSHGRLKCASGTTAAAGGYLTFRFGCQTENIEIISRGEVGAARLKLCYYWDGGIANL